MLFNAKCCICKAEIEGYQNLSTDPAYVMMICGSCYSTTIDGVVVLP